MRLIIRCNPFVSLLAQPINYAKSSHLRSLTPTTNQLLSMSINQDQVIHQPIKHLQILQSEPNPTKITKKAKTSKKSKAKAAKAAQEDTLRVQEGSLKQQFKSEEAGELKQKQTKPKKKRKSKTTKQYNYGQHPQQNNIMTEYPALNYLKEALVNSRPDLIPEFNWVKQSLISTEQKQRNSQQFMKIAGHSLPKTISTRIVRIIQTYCKGRQQKQASQLDKKEKKKQERQEQLVFNNIKRTLEKELFLSQKTQSQTADHINLLLGALKNTNPFSINSYSFDQSIFMRDFDEIPQEKFNFKLGMNQDLFWKQEKKEEEPTQGNTKLKMKNKVALQKALKLRSKTENVETEKSPLIKSPNHCQPEPLIQIKTTQDVLLFRQIPLSSPDTFKQEESKKYAYIYDLPYGLTKEDSRELVAYLQATKNIKITEYSMFPYNQYLDNSRNEIEFRVPEEYHEKRIEKVFKETKIQDYLNNEKQQYAGKRKAKMQVEDKNADAFGAGYSQDLATHSNHILDKIRQEEYSKFNRSVMVIKMASVENKQSIVTDWTRLFGLNFKHLKNIKFEEAHCKTIVVINGIPTGCTSEQLAYYLNGTLKDHRLEIEVEEVCYLTKRYVYIQFANFIEALRSIEVINDIQFQGKQLKAQLKYGPMKLFNKEYKPFEDNHETWKKLDQICEEYKSKFQEEDRILFQ